MIILLVCNRAHILEFNEIEIYEDNYYLSSAVNINMFQVLIVSMIWEQLGAVMDTSLSISSAMNEVYANNCKLKEKELWESGMKVGKSILGTTINTLTFAAIGESIMLTLVYISYNYSIEKKLNSKSFFHELSVIMISCIGCTLVIPLTAYIFSKLIKNDKVAAYFSKRKLEDKNI